MKIKIEFEVSDDLIEQVVTNFCKKFGIETITYDQRNEIIAKMCEVIEDELTDSKLDDVVDDLSLTEVKFKLGKKSFESMLK